MKSMSISEIKPFEKNQKIHSEKQVEQIANSIQEFGFLQPIVVDKKNVIIVGHGRYLAAQKLGLKEVPVVVADITQQQARAYRIADNKTNESAWNTDLLIQELKDLNVTGFDIGIVGFDLGFIQDNFNYKNTNTELDIEDDLGGSEEEKSKSKSCPNCGYEL